MDWGLLIGGLLLLAGAIDEACFRVARFRNHRQNQKRDRIEEGQKVPEYLNVDELWVISNDTDEVVYDGTPDEVYDWILRSRGVSSYDVYNLGTGKRVTSGKFLAKFVEEVV